MIFLGVLPQNRVGESSKYQLNVLTFCHANYRCITFNWYFLVHRVPLYYILTYTLSTMKKIINKKINLYRHKKNWIKKELTR